MKTQKQTAIRTIPFFLPKNKTKIKHYIFLHPFPPVKRYGPLSNNNCKKKKIATPTVTQTTKKNLLHLENAKKKNKNSINVRFVRNYFGPHVCGKTTEIIRRHRRLTTIGEKVLLVNHASNTRNDPTAQSISSHNNSQTQGSPVLALSLISEIFQRRAYEEAGTVIIDEGQFFEDLEENVLRMVEDDGKRVIVSGLIVDARRQPCGDIRKLIGHADNVDVLYALCSVCKNGTPGIYSHKKHRCAQTIGGSELYQTLCRRHYLSAVQRQNRAQVMAVFTES